MLKRSILTTAALALSVAPAFAHVSPEHASLLSGLAHPLSGADHVLAMVAVGLFAFQIGGRARFMLPAAFLGMLAFGFWLGVVGVNLPFVEPAILASVIGLGLLVALAIRVPATAGALIVGAFAVFHGHAHASELAGASALSFSLGFIAATMALHAIGLAAGSWLSSRGATAARIVGGMTALAGTALVFS